MGAIIEFPGWRPPRISALRPRNSANRRRRRRRHDRSAAFIVGVTLAALAFVVLSASIPASGADGIRARVIDGDTIENMATGERIRLVNIDTPETGERAHCSAERAAGERAEAEARDLIAASSVTIDKTGRVDAYGRTIAYVRVDGRDLGRILIERGLARPWRGHREPWCAADGSLLPAS